MKRGLLWWIGGVVMFVLMFDVALVAMGFRTISVTVTDQFGLPVTQAVFYFVFGGLFVHFTNWRTQGEDDKTDIFSGE